MGLAAEYGDRLKTGALRDDPAQAQAVALLQKVHDGLVATQEPSGGLGRFFGRKEKVQAVPGLYLWGGVGRGKSMLMDMFFDTVPGTAKRRVHFHAFMADIHDRLAQARAEGLRDPLKSVAADVTHRLRLLCFDELQITDITDAMIVGRLFDAMFDEGVTVVTTSNRHPTDLYKDGLNRKLFLPFIELICEKLQVHQLDSPTDHRQAALAQTKLYVSPLGPSATAHMDQVWTDLGGGTPEPLTLTNKGRSILIPRHSNGIGRASFADLCAQPLGASDYLLLAQSVAVVMIDDVPVLSPARNNEAKRFVTLIDALYEAGKPLVVSAEADPDDLYVDGAGAFEFERTASRLIEMRAAGWGREK